MTPSFFEGLSALSADAALVWFCVLVALGAAAALCGLYRLKQGKSGNGVRLLAMSVAVLLPAKLIYDKYQELLTKSNGVATGPIYENIALIVLMCLPLALVIRAITYRHRDTPKS
jgi:hypothetical protein